MKKQWIIAFFTKNDINKFSKLSEPSAIAYEKFVKKHPNVTFQYFNQIYNEIKLNGLPKKLSIVNVRSIIEDFPTKYNKGFIDIEIKQLLKTYKINEKTFAKKLGVHTAEMINNKIVTYRSDIELALKCILEKRDIIESEFD